MTEPLKSPAWLPRIAALAPLIVGRMTTAEVERAARAQLDWHTTLTGNVLAAGEGTAFWCEGNKWRRLTDYVATVTLEPEVIDERGPDRNCKHCVAPFRGARVDHVFCSRACRAANFRANKARAA